MFDGADQISIIRRDMDSNIKKDCRTLTMYLREACLKINVFKENAYEILKSANTKDLYHLQFVQSEPPAHHFHKQQSHPQRTQDHSQFSSLYC